jgi:hypothetical protein
MCLLRILSAFKKYVNHCTLDRGYLNRKYLLSDDETYHESMTYVPEDCIYVEEWVKGTETRRRILYEGEEITPYLGNPFEPVTIPWSWIGDDSTDVDITRAVNRYIMAGNTINLDLLFRFLRIHSDLKIVYHDSASGEDVVFPDEGIRITSNAT